MTQSRYPRLMAPIALGSSQLRNRIVMGAMHTRLDVLDHAPERIRAFYRERADGEVAMIITGCVAPNLAARLDEEAPVFAAGCDLRWHEAVVDSVRGTDTLMCLQLLHAGRYARFEGCVGPSASRARINRHTPRALETDEVWETIDDFARAARLARDLGYDAVEIMGSEGYLINEFTAPVTNSRHDAFGGDLDGRCRLPVEIVKATRRSTAPDFPILYRISAVDLVEGGMTGDETLELARRVVEAGADALNTGVGWHESDVPTIAHFVPRAAWSYATKRIRDAVDAPVIAANRINDPAVAEALLADGVADLVSMARPLLADPAFARKSRRGEPERINTCIACNQACLDRTFQGGSASCLVNPRAGHEFDFDRMPAPASHKRIAVVGGGAAGMSFAAAAAERGHHVVLYESAAELGGQLRMARTVPGKTEFDELQRYFERRLIDEKVEVRLNHAPFVDELANGGFDEVVIATGVRPRELAIEGIDHPMVLDYRQVLLERRPVGRRVAIIGAGGIGFDMVEYLLGDEPHVPPRLEDFAVEYGLDLSVASGGGRIPRPREAPARREVTLLQRRTGRLGESLGLSTGWIRRDKARRWGVREIGGADYRRIDDAGLHLTVNGEQLLLEVDSIIVCAGQERERTLLETLRREAPGLPLHVIGGADKAVELDAVRAIDQGLRLAMLC